MKQRVAAWLLRPVSRAYVVVLFGLIVVGAGVGAWVAVHNTNNLRANTNNLRVTTRRVSHDQSDLRAVVHDVAVLVRDQNKSINSPSHKRDILLWCDSINADRRYNSHFVRKVTRGQIPYTLAPLPCERIADEATRSQSTSAPLPVPPSP